MKKLKVGTLSLTKKNLKRVGTEGNFEDSSAPLQHELLPTYLYQDKAMSLATHTDSTLLTILQKTTQVGCKG